MKPRRRIVAVAVAGTLLIALAGELVARFVLRLADQPLYIEDRRIGYLCAPDQDCGINGLHFRTNRWSMRSADFPARKEAPDELRIMLLGDSIINGGNAIDQGALASEALRTAVAATAKRPVVVGNISTGGWSTVNEYAYLRRYGWFEADYAILEVNENDAWDVPSFGAIDPLLFPTTRPASALLFSCQRYGSRLFPGLGALPAASPPGEPVPGTPEESCLLALGQILRAAQLNRVKIAVVLHPTLENVRGAATPGLDALRAVAIAAAVPVVELMPIYRSSGDPAALYSDGLHLTARGQQALAKGFAQALAALGMASPP